MFRSNWFEYGWWMIVDIFRIDNWSVHGGWIWNHRQINITTEHSMEWMPITFNFNYKKVVSYGETWYNWTNSLTHTWTKPAPQPTSYTLITLITLIQLLTSHLNQNQHHQQQQKLYYGEESEFIMERRVYLLWREEFIYYEEESLFIMKRRVSLLWRGEFSYYEEES